MWRAEGELTAPNKLLSDFVNTLPKEEPVHMEKADGSEVLRIKCGYSKANVNGTSANLFPPVPQADGGSRVIITAEEFRKAVGRVAFCAAADYGRPVLTGMLVELEGDTITTVAADGFRMAVQHSKVELNEGGDGRAVVPARTMLEVQRIAGSADRQVEILMPEDGRNIRFLVGHEGMEGTEVEVTSSLLDGVYPDYEALIPRDLPNRAVFSLGELSRATRRAEIFARDQSHTVRFEVSREARGEGKVVISSEAQDLGNNRAELKTGEMSGSGATISLNGKYMQEALNSLNAGEVTLETGSPSSPVRIGMPGDEEYVHVMMPVITLENNS